MANVVYDNFYLSNEAEDQFNSHLDLARFCTVDKHLEGEPGMLRKINTYRATDGTEKLAVTEGNTQTIGVSYTSKEYRILLAQNRFTWYDEEAMTDPMIVPTGIRHMTTDMFNTINADVFAEFGKATLEVPTTTLNFDAFVDAVALLDLEKIEGVEVFSFVSTANMAKLRKNLKDTLQYVESFARTGYVGTVAGVNLYIKKDAGDTEVIVGTRGAVTLFTKRGTEIEQIRSNSNTRENTVYLRKYYLAALTDATKAVRIALTA